MIRRLNRVRPRSQWSVQPRVAFMANMIGRARIVACCALLAPGMAADLSADTLHPRLFELPPNRQVVAFLLQSVDWYRHAYAERQIANDPADLLFLGDNQPIELQVVRFSFNFAKAEAELASVTNPSYGQSTSTEPASPSSSDLARFIVLQNQVDAEKEKSARLIESLKGKLTKARGADRDRLLAARDEAQSRSELLQAAWKTINDLVKFAQSAAGGQGQTGNLSSTVDDLAQTVPEVSNPALFLARAPAQDANSGPVSSLHDGGMIGLWSEIAALKRKLRVIDEKRLLTDNLVRSGLNLRQPMAEFISQLFQKGAESSLRTGDLVLFKQDKTQLDALTVELNSLAPVIVALDKQKVLLSVYRSHLADWRRAVEGEYRQAWKSLILRLLVVVLVMGVLIAVSEGSRQVTERHIQDLDRRRRISIAQRLLTLAAILAVAAVGASSNLSSLATYFGLLAAGIAVALQNVIVASVGYLLLVGRRGIKVGDRVQISGIAGDVIDIGLLQFQLREFDLETQRLTEHVVTFSNSLIFVSPATGLVKLSPPYRVELRPDAIHSAATRTQGGGLAARL